MSEENKKSLVGRYYKWELSVLITSLLLIFWQIFGLSDATSLPLLDVKLRDPSKFPIVTSIILAIEFLFLWIEWKQSDEVARHTSTAKWRFGLIVVLAIAAVWINLPTLTKGTALADVSRFWYVFYFFIGLGIGALTSVIIFVTLMIRSDEESIKSPLQKIPVETQCVYRRRWPLVMILLAVSYVASCHAPFAVLQVAPWITALPIIYFVVEKIMSLFFFYDAKGNRVPVRQRVSKLKEIFKTHDYLYYLNRYGKQVSAQVAKPPNATPKQEQQAYQKHFYKASGSEELNTGSPLHNAAFAGQQELVEKLLENGSDINLQAGPGWTPLLAAVAKGYPKMVKLMLERGAIPDIANLQGITPLMYAARYGNLEIAKLLIHYGAKLDSQDIYGDTALAVAVMRGQESHVRLFISKGAKIDTRNQVEKLTPLELAHKYGHGKIARLLRTSK